MGRFTATLVTAAFAATMFVGIVATASQALPGIMPSIPGLESSITRRINNGVRRGRLTPPEANYLGQRLNQIEQQQQMLINSGRLNSFERSSIATQLEKLNSELRFDEATRTFAGRRLWPHF
ncbi:MAG TPA: hypothetical protein V6D22_11590 [Candidatus Obscuribacterales bacterium]